MDDIEDMNRVLGADDDGTTMAPPDTGGDLKGQAPTEDGHRKSTTETAGMIMAPPDIGSTGTAISDEEYQELKSKEAALLLAMKAAVDEPPPPGLVSQMRQANVPKENQQMVLQLVANGKMDLAENLVSYLTGGESQNNAPPQPTVVAPILECETNTKTRDAFAIKLLERQRPLDVKTFLRAVFKQENLMKLPRSAYQILTNIVDQILDPNTDSAENLLDLDAKILSAVPNMKHPGGKTSDTNFLRQVFEQLTLTLIDGNHPGALVLSPGFQGCLRDTSLVSPWNVPQAEGADTKEARAEQVQLIAIAQRGLEAQSKLASTLATTFKAVITKLMSTIENIMRDSPRLSGLLMKLHECQEEAKSKYSYLSADAASIHVSCEMVHTLRKLIFPSNQITKTREIQQVRERIENFVRTILPPGVEKTQISIGGVSVIEIIVMHISKEVRSLTRTIYQYEYDTTLVVSEFFRMMGNYPELFNDFSRHYADELDTTVSYDMLRRLAEKWTTRNMHVATAMSGPSQNSHQIKQLQDAVAALTAQVNTQSASFVNPTTDAQGDSRNQGWDRNSGGRNKWNRNPEDQNKNGGRGNNGTRPNVEVKEKCPFEIRCRFLLRGTCIHGDHRGKILTSQGITAAPSPTL